MISRLLSITLILFVAVGLLGAPGIVLAEDPPSAADGSSSVTSIGQLTLNRLRSHRLRRPNRRLQLLRSLPYSRLWQTSSLHRRIRHRFPPR